MKGWFYTHISTFSILNSAYTHIQGFIFVRRRRRLAFRVAILFWRYKGGFYTHISTFSILNSAYTHIQAFILVRRRRRLAFRVAILFWRYKGGFYTHISTFFILNNIHTFRVATIKVSSKETRSAKSPHGGSQAGTWRGSGEVCFLHLRCEKY